MKPANIQFKKTKDNTKEEAQENESDLSLYSALELNLKLTPEMRIEAHENSRVLLEDLYKAGEKLRAKSQRTS